MALVSSAQRLHTGSGSWVVGEDLTPLHRHTENIHTYYTYCGPIPTARAHPIQTGYSSGRDGHKSHQGRPITTHTYICNIGQADCRVFDNSRLHNTHNTQGGDRCRREHTHTKLTDRKFKIQPFQSQMHIHQTGNCTVIRSTHSSPRWRYMGYAR